MIPADKALEKLAKSKFRSSFSLTESDISYIKKKGMEVISSHADDFIISRIVPPAGERDGRQTPYRGHPVFKAMHACACCCRGCLYKWYGFNINENLSEYQTEWIKSLLMAWIKAEFEKKTGEKL